MQSEVSKSFNQDSAPQPIEDGIFELVGAKPAWMWVHTCRVPSCPCRAALIMATYEGRESLLERGQAVHDEWQSEGHRYTEMAKSLGDMIVFTLDIDSAQMLEATGKPVTSGTGNAQVADIAARMSGAHLDAFDDLWHHGKGCPTPEEAILASKKIKLDGWKAGDRLIWDGIFPRSRLDIYINGGHAYEASELYCPVPACECNEMIVAFKFFDGRKTLEIGHVMLQLSGEEGKIVSHKSGNRALMNQLLALYKARHQALSARLNRRYLVMKEVGKRVMAAEPEQEVTWKQAVSDKVGRNDPCPCGSGKKYKKCCGG
jgi:hypothetical protein